MLGNKPEKLCAKIRFSLKFYAGRYTAKSSKD